MIDTNPKKVSKDMIIDTIIDFWYNDEIINKEVIRNSYLYCTISNNLDTKDDELF